QRDEMKTRLEQLLKRDDEIKEKERALQSAVRASSIEPYELQLQEREQEGKSAEATMKNNEQQLRLAEQNVEQAKMAFDKEEGRNEEREQLTERLLVYEKYVPTVEAMNITKAQIDKIAEELKKLQHSVTEITKNIETNE